ncbi:HTH-type transcriptional repressor YtrA [Caloramator mitchellensis]|uniref:HTH-type transcriptional repressor YtrA n=1 Tax=Caloramator mitchellensis TaxID=908809 RepID=A0A0R3K2B1_CALMK|nr:GntR family transcriptional regulator [Caloramator mitchellensis]KRQ86431.1 HTH-type transcriptional repressor YtrA [Caloramator mitchellensis]
MFIEIDFTSEIPIYIQIKNQIIEGIAKGQLKEGDSLPSIRQLAEDIGINMHTINKAYNILKDLGFISINKKQGAYISIIRNIDKIFLKEVKDELKPIIAEAYCKGISKEDLFSIMEDIFDGFGGEKGE